jgi:hypothetical protein
MVRLLRLLLLVGALSGMLAQAQARTWLPHPVALAEKSMPDCEEGRGMEPPSDLFGEAALTEAQEREPCDPLDLDCISTKGCIVPVLVAEPIQFGPPIVEPAPQAQTRHRAARPFMLIRATYEPPRG